MSIAAEHPPRLRIEPRGPLDLTLAVPGSKSITNRALLVAALAEGESRLEGALESDDTRAMREALGKMGVAIRTDGADGNGWSVLGSGGRLLAAREPLDLGNAGTAMRFLTAACTLAEGETILDGNERMRERPIGDLVDALASLGAEIELVQPTGCPPVRTGGGGLPGGEAEIDASRSSQYVSAVLLSAPYAAQDVVLSLRGGTLVSRPYVNVTLQVMAAFGAQARWQEEGASVRVRSGRPYSARHYPIEPDASSAAYPLCAAAICGGRARVIGIPPDSKQSDLALLPLLARMGCRVVRGEAFVEVSAPEGGLASLGRVDMNDLPDAALAYAVVALFANAPTRIENIGNLRIKETDRLEALETELVRLGARVATGPDWIEVRPGPLHGAEIETYDDHRMAMAFALAGLRIPGVVIRDPDCVSKTWPDYFASFERW
jgi:3-phosphoshikimate 1-carboxyvinyltransferase